MILAIGMLSNVIHFSGIMFQVIYSVKRKNRATVDVLAAGGRYDTLLTRFRKPGPSAVSPAQAAVGVSIAYDKVTLPVIVAFKIITEHVSVVVTVVVTVSQIF